MPLYLFMPENNKEHTFTFPVQTACSSVPLQIWKVVSLITAFALTPFILHHQKGKVNTITLRLGEGLVRKRRRNQINTGVPGMRVICLLERSQGGALVFHCNKAKRNEAELLQCYCLRGGNVVQT